MGTLPNQALEPTTTAVTICADAGSRQLWPWLIYNVSHRSAELIIAASRVYFRFRITSQVCVWGSEGEGSSPDQSFGTVSEGDWCAEWKEVVVGPERVIQR